MNNAERLDSELTIFEDEMTGRTIWRLTNSHMEDKHSYYDISPWSPDQKYILFSAANAQDLTLEHKDTLATHHGQVYIIDTKTYTLSKIAGNAFYNTHTGAFTL